MTFVVGLEGIVCQEGRRPGLEPFGNTNHSSRIRSIVIFSLSH